MDEKKPKTKKNNHIPLKRKESSKNITKNNHNLSTLATYTGFNLTSATHAFGISTFTTFKPQPEIHSKNKKTRKEKSVNKSLPQKHKQNLSDPKMSVHHKKVSTKAKDHLSRTKSRDHLTKSKSKKCLVVNLKKTEQSHKQVSSKLVKKRKKNMCKINQIDEDAKIEQKVRELTDRKKNHLEFFYYKNKEIPIENTEQRKFALKIKFIDERSVSYSLSHREEVQPLESFIIENHFISDQSEKVSSRSRIVLKPPITSDKAIETEIQVSSQKCCQTEQDQQPEAKVFIKSQIPSLKREQKCFMEALSELQFLYLPDESNFEGFSNDEKQHYKQLLLYIAKKFEENECGESHQNESLIEFLIEQRQSRQRGMSTTFVQNGIPTHSPSIISYLSNFFCFLEIHEKKSLVARLNSSYGYSLLEKLTLLKKGKPTHRHCRLISESTFWAFEQELHEGLQFDDQNVEQYLHYHNRAIFDCVNEFIEEYQPYFPSNGQPFPWSCNLETTFYCIDEDSFSALGCQIKQKIWECSQNLAGIIIDSDELKKAGQSENIKHKQHIQKIIQNESKMVNNEIKKESDRIEIDQKRTVLLVEVADLLKQELLKQFLEETTKWGL